LFLFFAEDKELLPPNSVKGTVDKWKKFNADPMNDYQSLYSRFVKYFKLLDTGYKDTNTEIFAYNGGLFANDEFLNQLRIDDDILSENILKLAAYDYDTDVDVNILGHIFENSLNEIEEVTNEITSGISSSTLGKPGGVSKRKQDGVFYTPRYITQYIVENTVGRLCEEKKAELGISTGHAPLSGPLSLQKKEKQALYDKFTAYREWLLHITIVDPACGSGAFLNRALDFLIAEHGWIDRQQDKIAGLDGHFSMELSNIENVILENNLFGVDINDESVEIARLSLWLRTAKPHRKLSSLNNNIKCGNSLIDDPAVAGEKAFDWHKEFPQIFHKKEKKAWHITTATHNSRYSQRMFDNYVKLGEPVWLTEEEEQIITRTIAEIAVKDQLNILAYNICGDHVHIALVCEEEEVEKITGKLKSMSARAANIAMGRTVPATTGRTRGHAPVADEEAVAASLSRTRGRAPLSISEPTDETPVSLSRGETQTVLWTQKFGCKEITSKEQLQNTINYIRNNRKKHGLPDLFGGKMRNDDRKEYPNENRSNYGTEDRNGNRNENPYNNKGACPLVACPLVIAPISETTVSDTLPVTDTTLSDSSVSAIPVVYPRTVSPEYAFRPEYKGGFDVVIGNPPYVRAELLSDWIEYYQSKYKAFQPAADLFTYFYEFGFSILKSNGVFGFISNTFDKTKAAIVLREWLKSNTTIYKYIDFTDVQIFEGTTTYPIILIARNQINKKNNFEYIKILKGKEQTIEFHTPTNVEQENLEKENWTFKDNKSNDLIKKICNYSPITVKYRKCYYGVKTALNEAFLIPKELFSSKEFIKPIYEGRELSKWTNTDYKQSLILFKSKSTKEKYGDISESDALGKLRVDQPSIIEHLLLFEEKAKARYDKGEFWWELRNCAYYHLFEQPKIIFPNLQNKNKFSIDEMGVYINAPAVMLSLAHLEYPIPEGKFLLSILNSKLIWYFLKSICVVRSGGYIEVKPQYFEQIPIPEIAFEKQQPFISKADSMLSYNKELQLLVGKFQRMMQRKFGLEELPGKLQNWYLLSYKEFIAELGKKKVKLTLAQEAEWEEYFHAEQAIALEIKKQIDDTDREIDRMVYELYGLTEEEVGIVEG
jgi:REP element-mobilizing transposase RayT